MIEARLAAPRRAALLTSLLLAAAALRAALQPFSDLLSTLAFAICLLGIAAIARPDITRSIRERGGGWPWPSAVLAGIAVGALLLAPVLGGRITNQPLAAFWWWAAIAAVVATLEEVAIRGALYRQWLEETGPLPAVLIGAGVFALIHLPRYGIAAMPLDFAVGLVLGGLRALSGRVLPCALAHVIADWGAWFWR